MKILSKETFESILKWAIEGREDFEKKLDYTTDSAFLGSIRDILKASEAQESIQIDTRVIPPDSELPTVEEIQEIYKSRSGITEPRLLDRDALVIAFIQGAKWWEYKKTGATMWKSDQVEAEKAAQQLPTLGQLTLGKP